MQDFFKIFTKIDSYEDCPVGVNLLVWDGCDYHFDYVDVDVDTGVHYAANGTEFCAYYELPDQSESIENLGSGE